MKKFNLSEAAAEILDSNVASKKKGQDSTKKATDGQTKEVGDIGTEVTKVTDSAPDATKGVPTATAPGAKPPVGAEAAKKITGQPAQKNEEIEAEDEDLIEEEKEEGHEDEAEDKKMIKKMMKKEKMEEDVNALLQGENLSEEFVAKATTIFEAAVISRVSELAEEVEAQLNEQYQTAVQEMKEDFAEKIDDYLNYMVEEWMKENQLAIESGLRSEIVEDFIGGLKNLFTEHYIDIPEEKVSVVEELASKVEQLEDALNEEIERSVELKKEINEHVKDKAIQAVCEGLTQTQVEKLKSLAESVEFTTEEEFTDKINTLKEAYATSTVKVAEKSVLEEGVDVEEEKQKFVSSDPFVDAVAKSISKSAVR